MAPQFKLRTIHVILLLATTARCAVPVHGVRDGDSGAAVVGAVAEVSVSTRATLPACARAVTVLTIHVDARPSRDAFVCEMFREIAQGLVWALGQLGVAAEEACCRVMGPDCWSFSARAPVAFANNGQQVKFTCAHGSTFGLMPVVVRGVPALSRSTRCHLRIKRCRVCWVCSTCRHACQRYTATRSQTQGFHVRLRVALLTGDPARHRGANTPLLQSRGARR